MLTIGPRPVKMHYHLSITGYGIIRNYPYLALLLITILSELREMEEAEFELIFISIAILFTEPFLLNSDQYNIMLY